MDNECNFKCYYMDKNGECRQGGGQCLEDDCPDWMDCNACRRADVCDP